MYSKKTLFTSLIVFFIFFQGKIFAKSGQLCLVTKTILYSILMNERSYKREIGYEYLISFNEAKDSKKVRSQAFAKSLFVDSRTLDCRNQKLCASIVKKLVESKIVNLDLGAYQINYRIHKLPIKDYFDFKKSYDFACSYVSSNIKELGYSWYAISAYHSRTPKYNKKYTKELLKNYNMIKGKIK